MYQQYQPPAPGYPLSANAEYYAQKMREIAGYGYPPPQMAMPQQQPGMICRAVTSIDEAKAAMIDAFSTYIFADFTGGKIYVKRIENNGSASLQTFAAETPAEKPADYAGQIAALEKRISGIEAKKNGEDGE